MVNEPWFAQISKQDPRFASIIPIGNSTLQNYIEELPIDLHQLGNTASVSLLNDRLKDIQALISEIRKQPLEKALMQFFTLISKEKGKRLVALSRRIGWNGKIPATLDECRKPLGLTRERMRQIQVEFLDGIPDHEIFMPQIDEALSLLEEKAPIALDKASKVLQENGITHGNFHPQSLLNIARLLRKKTTLQICEMEATKILVSGANLELVQLVQMVARKLSWQSGITSVFAVRDLIKHRGYKLEVDYVRRALNANATFEFLDESWFWATDIQGSRNRLYKVTRRMLSVFSPQSLIDIRDGLERVCRANIIRCKREESNSIAPHNVIGIFLTRHPHFKVENELVYSSTPLNYKRILSTSDRIMVDALRSASNGVMSRANFFEACQRRGMNKGTFNVQVTRSYILDKIGNDLWKLRGVTIGKTGGLVANS